MRYTIKAHPTTYAGVRFRSRLEARWAAFFDAAAWSWQYEPIDTDGWSPDFLVTIPPGEYDITHQLYVEVKPYAALEDFHAHPAWSMLYGDYTPTPAVFGVSPVVSLWVDRVQEWHIPTLLPSWDRLWRDAGNAVQWRAAA